MHIAIKFVQPIQLSLGGRELPHSETPKGHLVDVVVLTPKGREITLTLTGKEHSIWESHQVVAPDFAFLRNALVQRPGEYIKLDIVSIGEPYAKPRRGKTPLALGEFDI